ncbi:MAG TPA: DUF5040 domain-containing protein [Paludibacter sp.]
MKKTFILLLGILCSVLSYPAAPKYHFMLTGASFAVPENGWFELSCKAFDAEPINKAISGEAIFDAANRMAANTFCTKDELERTDVFIIMQVHNQNVADHTWLKENYADYTMPTTNYAVAYDYVIKRYKDDCYKLKNDPTSKYYGTPNGKPAVILLCTHWHDSRTVYNPAIRILAQKWNLPLVEWDTNIGFTKDVLINGQQPSIQYAMNNEVINGVTYGWHPLRGQEQYIQKKISSIFNAAMEKIVGAIPVSATVSAKANAILSGETATVNVNFTGLPPWNFSYNANGQTVNLTNITDNPLKLNFTITSGDNLLVEPVSVSNNSVSEGTVSGQASVSIADKVVTPSYDAYVHQANATTSYTTDQFVQVKTTTDNYSREAFFTFNLNNISATDEKMIFRTYFYQNVYPANASLVENHLVEIDGNTDNYSTLTWNTRPTNMTKIGETLIYPTDMGGYVSWDITSWVKEQIAAGRTKATLRLKVINSGSGLLYFYSSESATNKPQLIISSPTTTGITKNTDNKIMVLPNGNNLKIENNAQINAISIHSVSGKCIYRNNNITSNALSINSSQFPVGMYLLNVLSENQTWSQKFIKR